MALYAKMKGPVGYTVVGSPTITDGVVSGFSASKYLTINQQLDTSKPYELCSKFKLTATNVIQSFFGVSTAGILNMVVRATGTPAFFVGKTTSAFDIADIRSTTVLSANTDYWLKGIFTGTKYQLYLSTDGVNFNLEGEVTSSEYANNGNPISLQIGNGNSANWYLRGSIDLKETYIKVNNQLWFGYDFDRVKIRTAPYVRYTVVGSPTLINGVLSGTSAGNYVRTDTKWSISENFEIVMRAKPLQASGKDALMCIHDGRAGSLKLWFSTTQIRLMPNTSTAEMLTINGTFSNTDFYYVKATKNGATGTLSYSTDGVNWTGTVSSDTLTWGTRYDYVDFGINPNWPVYFGGEIDLNNSYIKDNGQYWWRGDMQNVETYSIRTNPFVRYTVVGSPMITDGVASGFSVNNYLSLNPIMVDINDRDFEIIINATKLGGSGYGARSLLWANSFSIDVTNGAGLRLRTWTKKSGESSYTERSVYNFNFATNNNTQWIKCTKVGKVFSIEGSNNGMTYTTGHNYTLEEGEEVRASSTTVFCQSNAWGAIGTELLLNNSYIKVDSQYWWCGNIQYQL